MAKRRNGNTARDPEKPRRRHHTVSKFYLDGFADGKGQIQQIHVNNGHSHPTATSNATVQNHFYSIPLPDGSVTDALERAMEAVESPGAEALRRIRAGVWPPSPQDKAALGMWIALQYMRGTAQRDAQTQLNAQTIRMIVLMARKDGLRRAIETRRRCNHLGRALRGGVGRPHQRVRA